MQPAPHRRHAQLRRSTAIAAALACTLVLGACTAGTVDGSGHAASARAGSTPSSSAPSGSATPVAPAQPKADFKDCKHLLNLSGLPFPPGREKQLSFDCARIQVPLDYADPGGRTISVQLIRVHSGVGGSTKRQLVVNPGGPGASGLELAVDLSTEVPDKLLSDYDLVGFDPRGVELSSPINCISNSRKDYLNALSPNVLTTAGFDLAKSVAMTTARACTAKYGSALADYTSVNTAKDMDQIRQSLGEARMDYLGFSYGTELGSLYAHYFPSKVGRMVLDGAVDPLTSGLTQDADQLAGFEQAFDQFAAYCVKTAPCNTLGNPRRAVYALQKRTMRTPIPATAGRTATYNLFTTGVLSALYSKSRWPVLGQALVNATRGHGAGIVALADTYNERYTGGTYSNIADANLTIYCNDSKPGPSNATIRATARSWVSRFPIFGLSNAATLFGCQQWQPKRTVPPLPTAATPGKVVVIGNLHDPATPYQGAVDLAKTMGNALLLSWDGEGHTSYLQGSTCINGYVNAYFETGTLPPSGRTCPAG